MIASDHDLATEVIRLARDSGRFIATAESVTGGLVAAALTAVAGASEVFIGAVVCYTDAVKTQLLGVSPQLIQNQSAVDAEVAAQLADGCRDRFVKIAAIDSERLIAVATTGVAGPAAVGNHQPGVVFIGCSSADGVSVYGEDFAGDRGAIRAQAATRVLEILREQLAG
jgi:PncC family amidohydrolase